MQRASFDANFIQVAISWVTLILESIPKVINFVKHLLAA
jgi:hypothetical protein